MPRCHFIGMHRPQLRLAIRSSVPPATEGHCRPSSSGSLLIGTSSAWIAKGPGTGWCRCLEPWFPDGTASLCSHARVQMPPPPPHASCLLPGSFSPLFWLVLFGGGGGCGCGECTMCVDPGIGSQKLGEWGSAWETRHPQGSLNP